MFNEIKKEIEWGGKTLSLETGKIARQADGSVIARCGDTVVLCAVTAQKEAKEGIDFFPLTVNYIEKTYSAGKIPGGFFKREGRPSEKEILTSRLIDRPIRPLFPEHFYNETQVVCTVLSYDDDVNPDIVALIASSAALSISGVPFLEPIAGVRVGIVDGEYVINPNSDQLQNSSLDLVVAGTESSVLMVESEAKELTKDQMLEAVMFAHQNFQPVINLIKEFTEAGGKERWAVNAPDYKAEEKLVNKFGQKIIADAYAEQDKQLRVEKLGSARSEIMENTVNELGEEANTTLISYLTKKLEKDVVRTSIIKDGSRIDGRKSDQVRQIESEVSVLPKTHGSALFTRGETQALAVATLGTSHDQQIIDALEGESKQTFMLHYNFPPYSVGEAYPLRAPGRREIGHGKLAYRALSSVLPTQEEFPYTIRLVSEITESNGSSSMATVCSSSLALMDAGVPIKSPVAGIAMGLIKEDKDYCVLSDIMGDEDHLGDMDFKVAGTSNGITALQMDIKINGINEEIMKKALAQADEGRAHILSRMSATISESKTELSNNAPKMTTIQISKDKIREIIGPGGQVIKDICEKSGAKIEINDDGIVNVAAKDGKSAQIAIDMVNNIVKVPEVGHIHDGEVKEVLDFGAIVTFGKDEGFVHISEVNGERVEDIHEVVSAGNKVKIKIISVERNGKVKASMKRVDQKTGEDIDDFPEDNFKKGKKKPFNKKPKGPRKEKSPEKEDNSDKPTKKRFF